jgi:hypothetical protein
LGGEPLDGLEFLVDFRFGRAARLHEAPAWPELRVHHFLDLPGTTWRDRPAISRSNTLAVATDQSAAPGLLAEVAITAAQLAVQQQSPTGTRRPSRG